MAGSFWRFLHLADLEKRAPDLEMDFAVAIFSILLQKRRRACMYVCVEKHFTQYAKGANHRTWTHASSHFENEQHRVSNLETFLNAKSQNHHHKINNSISNLEKKRF